MLRGPKGEKRPADVIGDPATIVANKGATARQMTAIFGWDTIREAEHHTRKADQKQLAEAAIHLLEKR